MKRILFIALFSLLTTFSFGQFVNTQTIASPTTLFKSKGGIGADSAFILLNNYSDTTAANFSVASKYAGSFIRVDTNIYYRTLNPNRWNLFAKVGSTGTIVSIGQGYGIVNSPNPITTVGTITTDTTVIVSKSYFTNFNALNVKYADTSAMLTPYLRKSDTLTMLNPYLRKSDTSNMLDPYVRKTRLINTNAPLAGGGSLANDLTLVADTGRATGQLSTGGSLNKVKDSLVSLISMSGGGTVLSVATTDGIGIISSVANPTSNPNISIRVDTLSISTKANVQKVRDSLLGVFVPYSGATTTVNLNTQPLIAGNVLFNTINNTNRIISSSNGSGTEADGAASVTLQNTLGTLGWITQLGGTNELFWSYYSSGSWVKKVQLLSNGTFEYINNYGSLFNSRSLVDKGYVDSSVGLRLRISDTSAMLSPYLRKTDTATMLSGYTRINRFLDTTSVLRALINTKGTGTVASVGLSLPAIFSVSGSPVTSSGTLSASLANQNANLVFAGPSTGSPAQPTFRALVAADFPSGVFVPYSGAITTVDLNTQPLIAGNVTFNTINNTNRIISSSNGSGTEGDGAASITLQNTAGTNGWIEQLGGTNELFWSYNNGSSWDKKVRLNILNGFEYYNNYGSLFTTRSLIDKGYVDSSVALRVRISDTSSMLSPYLRKSDTLTMLSPYLRKSDTLTMLSPYLRKTDTATMLSPYARSFDLRGTANQVIITPSGRISTFSLPQSIATSSDVQFNAVGVGAAPNAAINLDVIGNRLIAQRLSQTNGFGIKLNQTSNTSSHYKMTINNVADDSTFFVVNQNGKVIIGGTTANPTYTGSASTKIIGSLSIESAIIANNAASNGVDVIQSGGGSILSNLYRAEAKTQNGTTTIDATATTWISNDANNYTWTLPNSSSLAGGIYLFCKQNAAGTITLSGTIIDKTGTSVATYALTGASGMQMVYYNGSSWFVIN